MVGASPFIDVKQSAAFATVEQQALDHLPKDRDFTSVIVVAPGAQYEDKSAGHQIDGASGAENRYIIDGMDTTALAGGLSGKAMPTDFIEQVQVVRRRAAISSWASAQAARTSGSRRPPRRACSEGRSAVRTPATGGSSMPTRTVGQ